MIDDEPSLPMGEFISWALYVLNNAVIMLTNCYMYISMKHLRAMAGGDAK